MKLSIAIPTYGRGDVLIATIRALLEQSVRADEILILDQTQDHAPQVVNALADLDRSGAIRWLRLAVPSIPITMNRALIEARHDIILFLDDDVIPAPALVEAHLAAHVPARVWAVAGQVLQPGELPTSAHSRAAAGDVIAADLDFRFSQTESAEVANVMAGNLSVKRERAIAIGGFDENFVGVAYRFESDFAQRLVRARGTILFEPAASIRHLRAPAGGTRTWGNHLTSASPMHSVGDYYFALHSTASAAIRRRYILGRMVREVRTRFHLRHPWWIPVKLVGELRGLVLAARLRRRGRRLLNR